MSRRTSPHLLVRALVGAGAFALVASGCSLLGSDDAAEGPATTEAATTTTAPAPTSEPPELLDAGAEPHQTLRVAYTEGDRATVTFTSDIGVTQTTDGRTQRLDSPPIEQTLTYTVGAVTDRGAELTIQLDDVTVKAKGTGLADDEVAALETELQAMVGFEATAIATPLGELEDVAFTIPGDASEALAAQISSLEDQLGTLGPSLPVEPVGVGAVWRSIASSTVGGATVKTTSTVTVTDIDEQAVSYTTVTTTAAEEQPLELAGVAEGTTATLRSSDLEGSGTGKLGLEQVDLGLQTRVTGTQEISLATDEGSTELTQQLDIAQRATTARG